MKEIVGTVTEYLRTTKKQGTNWEEIYGIRKNIYGGKSIKCSAGGGGGGWRTVRGTSTVYLGT
jgi:hypothetical protein